MDESAVYINYEQHDSFVVTGCLEFLGYGKYCFFSIRFSDDQG